MLRTLQFRLEFERTETTISHPLPSKLLYTWQDDGQKMVKSFLQNKKYLLAEKRWGWSSWHEKRSPTYPFTFELFLPGCRGSWEEAGSLGSAGWSASWLDAAPAGAGPDEGEAELVFNVFCRFDTWGKEGERQASHVKLKTIEMPSTAASMEDRASPRQCC